MNAAPEIAFSSEQGKANYAAARRQYPAQAIVNLKTMRDNMAHLVSVVGGPNSGTAVMGVVKADAYGHGLLPSALAALAGGATWLGTAQSHEALLLRKLGIGPDRCHILTWVYNGTEVPFDELIAADIDVSVGSLPGIDAVAAAARKLGKPARVHVKVDSGFGRNASRLQGSPPRLPSWCHLPRKACCISSASGVTLPWPIRLTCLSSWPPPTARSKRLRTSPHVWKRPEFRRRFVIWPTLRPLWIARKFISSSPAPASGYTATSLIRPWAPRAIGI